MTTANKNSSLFFFLSFFVIIPTLQANIGVYDDYWKQRQANASKIALKAYHLFPVEVTNDLNYHVGKTIEAYNQTRRNLKEKKGGSCEATNPIDKCWRCDPNWESNRYRLADCALGFGRNTTGGKNGPIYVVTDPSDNDLINPKPGTLRYAVTRTGPLWITFKHGMIIRLQQELIMSSDKTIDGRGANVQIRNGAGITLQFIHNVIIHNIHVHDIKIGAGGMIIDSEKHYGIRTRSDGDGISIFGSSNVWIDHVSMSRCSDGMIDAIQGSTAITISNCHLTHHNEVMLFGASDSCSDDAKMQITVAFNHFGKGLVQRMPRARWGIVHVVNNDYTHWQMYAIGGSSHPTIISQGNRFIASLNQNTKEVTKRDYATEQEWKQWLWTSENDLMMNGAFFRQSGPPNAPNPIPCQNQISAQSGTLVGTITKNAGTLPCKRGLPC